jgi:NAD(P)-dependent dehydrogenase (short-subunit alcohol dehydrogenase family)
MQISGVVALVTGANRGLGAQYVQALLDRGAAKVYAGARDIATITDPRAVALQLDVTDKASIAAAAKQAQDVTLVVNNAGVGTLASGIGDESEVRWVMETNYFGLLAVTRDFAPILAANGGGGLVNVLSDASWCNSGLLGAYAASKAAAWSATNALRMQLSKQGTLVIGVHCGFLDTDATAGFDVPKLSPRVVADLTLDALEKGEYEVLADESSRKAKTNVARSIEEAYPDLVAVSS